LSKILNKYRKKKNRAIIRLQKRKRNSDKPANHLLVTFVVQVQKKKTTANLIFSGFSFKILVV